MWRPMQVESNLRCLAGWTQENNHQLSPSLFLWIINYFRKIIIHFTSAADSTDLEIPAWISNYIHYKVWDEITYPFLNFNGATVEV